MSERMVLLFNPCADASRAARLHSVDCPMAVTSGRRVIRVAEAEIARTAADLQARGFAVRECSCVAKARNQTPSPSC